MAKVRNTNFDVLFILAVETLIYRDIEPLSISNQYIPQNQTLRIVKLVLHLHTYTGCIKEMIRRFYAIDYRTLKRDFNILLDSNTIRTYKTTRQNHLGQIIVTDAYKLTPKGRKSALSLIEIIQSRSDLLAAGNEYFYPKD